MNVQYKKGVLDLCVLALLARKDCYGFEIVTVVSENISMSEGTIYPLLKRMKDEGWVDTYLVESPEGPPRKYYTLTEAGREHYAYLKKEWREFCEAVEQIIEGLDVVEDD